MIQRTSLRRALAMSVVLHAIAAVIAGWAFTPARSDDRELVDIEVAPPPPLPEALPPEVAKPPAQDLAGRANEPEPASTAPSPPGEGIVDAGVDAPIDAPIDAPPDARRPRPDAAPRDAGVDAAVPDDGAPDDAAPTEAITVASAGETAAHDDAGVEVAAIDDAHAPAADAGDDVAAIASGAGSNVGSGSGSGSGSGAGGDTLDTGALAAALAAGSGSGVPGATDEPAVDGAPTTAGTAANLLSYFPDGHVVTALIRLDRLRGTEWAAQAERLLRPMPDYRLLFGARDANLTDQLETLVISTPRPRDAVATTLVARTALARPALRDFLAAGAPVAWSTSKGGLLGRRTGALFPGDQRVFLSPFKGWFLLAQPGDLGGLTAAAKGSPDAVEATGKLPPWLAGIRKIESESGDKRGPALVVTIAGDGQRVAVPGSTLGLAVASLPTPQRLSLAMELVTQGWLVRGNMHFASEADATEIIASVQQLQKQIAGSRGFQLVLGKPVAHVIANLAFARNGARVSYATSVSIADARALLTAAGLQLDAYFSRPGSMPEPPPAPRRP